MHEQSIAESLFELIRQHAQKKPVQQVQLAVGKISGVYPDSLTFYLDLFFKENQQETAVIDVKEIPALVRCKCGNEYEPENLLQGCPKCGGFEREIMKGQECTVESIEVKD